MTAPVMWKMSRVRLDRVGPSAARFLDVTLDFTDERDGHPLDSILWLRNGGGKSTLLSLVCALIRPRRRDFLATAATGKHLEDYVLGADTAHVVVEWSGPDGRRLVTGAVHEWADRAQPADPNRDHDRLNSRWYLFRPQPGRAELDLLPFEIDGRPATQKDFLAAVRAWDAVPQAGVAITDGLDRWARLLDEHGLDPAIFTALLQMNATEGGIEGQFQFRNADQFVRYLLELIVDPEVPGQVSAILERVRAGLAERPELLADLAFASEAAPLLRSLAEGRATLAGAEEAERAEQERAARLAGAIAAGVGRARREEAAYSDRQQELAAHLTELRGLAATAEELESALRGLAARNRVEAAREELAQAQAGQERARAELAAWRAVVDVLRLRDARARVRSLEEQLAAAEEDAEPLRRRLAEAAARYARSLDAALAEQTEQVAVLEERLSAARAAADAARERARAATRVQGTLSGELAALRTRLAELDAGIDASRAQGHLDPEEEVAAAVERHRAADAEAAAELDRLLQDRAGLRERRDELRAAADSLATGRRTLAERHRVAAERRAGLRARAAELAADDRLRALAGGDEVDPITEAGDLEALLTAAIARADRHRVELAVEGAEDERALAALGTSGLLPPALDLARAQEAVEAAGIAVATGWRHLADSVPQREHEAVLRAAPALASGLLVHAEADLPTARRALAAAGLRPTTALVLATTAELDAVVQESRSPRFELVTPAAALTDPAAAGAETAAREQARAARASRDAALVADRERDDDLRRHVRALRADCPPGTLEALDAEVAAAAEELGRVDEDAALVAVDLAAVDEREQECEHRREAAEAIRRAAGVAGAVLRGMAERLVAAEEARERAQVLPVEIDAAQREVERAGAEEEAARRTAREAEERAAAVRRSVSGLREARDGLDVSAGDPDTADAPPVAEAQRAWESAGRAYAREVSDSALVAAVAEARRAVEVPAQQVAALPPAVQEAATALVDGPDAVDAEARAAAVARAEQTARAADEAVGSARSAVALTESELGRHPTVGDLPDPPPPDAATALALADGAAEEHARHRAAAERVRAEHEKAGGLRAEARERASELGHQGQLLGVAPPEADEVTAHEVTADEVLADEVTVDQATAEVTAVRDRLDAAGAAVRRGRGAVEKVAREIVLWSAADRFAAVKPAVRDRFRVTDVAGELGPEAEDLARELETYAANLRGRLEELEEHKSVVVTAMTGMVRQALKALARAQSLSELPENLGPWAGHRFLEVGPRSAVETADAVVRDRCARLVDLLTSRGAEVPRGQELLWQATNAVVGDGNWKARVLKPSTALALERVPVERMRKWSGGEKVTISLLLFCMVAKLRATSRGRDLPGLGALPLDNPLGKANYVVFLDLQRKVAAANGVQLIFLTGVGDMKAVGRFPNIIRLRNTANRGREYVRVADRTQAGEDPAGAVDVTRIHRDDPVLTLL
ncbi:hypothetical protein GCM10023215_36890 [Pseudonocardia yuanmonensis]|uniref:Chromosome partition protein Smc n=1 Tax=Pseudonocardia yuanmonensis TaxID=1095914 RepID=A0ABP8WUR2_9PSEU